MIRLIPPSAIESKSMNPKPFERYSRKATCADALIMVGGTLLIVGLFGLLWWMTGILCILGCL